MVALHKVARIDGLESVEVVHTDDALMRAAGDALATGATSIDAIVMATAALRGVVFTSDVGDLTKLQRAFPAVRAA